MNILTENLFCCTPRLFVFPAFADDSSILTKKMTMRGLVEGKAVTCLG